MKYTVNEQEMIDESFAKVIKYVDKKRENMDKLSCFKFDLNNPFSMTFYITKTEMKIFGNDIAFSNNSHAQQLSLIYSYNFDLQTSVYRKFEQIYDAKICVLKNWNELIKPSLEKCLSANKEDTSFISELEF